MSSETLYKVVFEGIVTGEYDLDTTKKRFGRAFKLNPKQVERVFAGKEVTLKSKLEEAAAMEYAFKLAEIGCECYVESLPDLTDVTQDPNFVERRKGSRRLRFRRDPRPGAIVPDRRSQPSRRKDDLDLLERTGSFPGMTLDRG